ncbi:hypothetical protein NDU88_008174 [Pleurodeles waltl]|uniref:Secreted protein n=1 Tax=Pleurodeles waltl TaxID=8319 RepID=A0AAV7N467_PLEWA|nr:hypothetical protein NDU88_008174 [Pleurodeles waltl]
MPSSRSCPFSCFCISVCFATLARHSRKRRPLLAHTSLAWNCRERLQGNGDANSCSNSGVDTHLQGNGDAVPAALTRMPTRAAIPNVDTRLQGNGDAVQAAVTRV